VNFSLIKPEFGFVERQTQC